ncbi:cation transport regulator [Citrobacter koseri]|nr:cation transport regulator [Citrobacter koseri]
MPYKTKSDLPESVQDVLPAHAQDIYKEAFNSAWEQYKDKRTDVTTPAGRRPRIRLPGLPSKMITKKGMMISGIKSADRLRARPGK